MPKIPKSQADKRRSVRAKDQFGRVWGGSIEIESGDFTGLVDAAGWEDPLRTPQRFVKMLVTEYGHPDLGRVEVHLDEWIRFQSQSMTDWTHTFFKVGKELYANRFDPKAHSDDEYLLKETGAKPWPSVECIEVLQTPNHPAHQALLGNAPLNDAAIVMLGRDPDELRAAKDAGMTMAKKAAENAARMSLTTLQFLAIEPTPTWKEFAAYGAVNHIEMKELGVKWKAFKEINSIPSEQEGVVVPVEDLAPEMETV